MVEPVVCQNGPDTGTGSLSMNHSSPLREYTYTFSIIVLPCSYDGWYLLCANTYIELVCLVKKRAKLKCPYYSNGI